MFDSVGLADYLERLHTTSRGAVTFVIGGAYGLSDSIIQASDLVLSLSRLTFSHRLARLVLLEQLYRAFTIIHNTGYHK